MNYVLTKNSIYNRKKIARELTEKAGKKLNVSDTKVLEAMVDAEIESRESIYSEDVSAEDIDVTTFTPGMIFAGVGVILSLVTVLGVIL